MYLLKHNKNRRISEQFYYLGGLFSFTLNTLQILVLQNIFDQLHEAIKNLRKAVKTKSWGSVSGRQLRT